MSDRPSEREPLVCIHGFSGSWRNWAHVLPVLETRFDTVAVRLRGHAEADPLPGGTAPTVDALADALEADLDRAGVGAAHLVGNSLGGWLALELAARGRARSVVALSPAGGWEPDGPATRRLRRIMPPSHALSVRLRRHAELVMGAAPVRRAMLRLAMEHGERLGVSEGAAFLRANADCTVYGPLLDDVTTRRYTLPALDVPVHIAWGARDRLLTRRGHSERFRTLVPNATFSELPGAGHIPMYDVPAAVIDTVLATTGAAQSGAAQSGTAQSGTALDPARPTGEQR